MKIISVLLILATVGLAGIFTVAQNNTGKSFVYFGAEWCAPCRQMQATLRNNNVAAALRSYKVVIVDIDFQPKYAKDLGVDAVPTYVILDESGKEVKRGIGYRNPTEFLQWLK